MFPYCKATCQYQYISTFFKRQIDGDIEKWLIEGQFGSESYKTTNTVLLIGKIKLSAMCMIS